MFGRNVILDHYPLSTPLALLVSTSFEFHCSYNPPTLTILDLSDGDGLGGCCRSGSTCIGFVFRDHVVGRGCCSSLLRLHGCDAMCW